MTIKGAENFVVRFRGQYEAGNSQIYDNGNQVGIGTNEPGQRLDVNGSVAIHDRNSNVAGLMITASTGTSLSRPLTAVGTKRILSTVSMPPVTLPNTA